MSGNFIRNYLHGSEHSSSYNDNYRQNNRHIAEQAPGRPSWELKFVDEYLARLAYEKQQQMRNNDDSGRSLSTSTDPASEDFDMDEVSMPDSIQLHRNDLTSSTRRRPRIDFGRQHCSSMILEDVPYAPSSLATRSESRNHNLVASRVAFAEEALMYSCDFSYHEVLRMWYSKEDLASFKQDRKDLIKVLKKHHFDLAVIEKTYGRKYCLRGYEPYFSLEGNKEIRRNRENVLSAVLSEQTRQRQRFGMLSDPDIIAKHCADASKWARDCGYRLGSQDANEMLKEYGQDIKPRDSYQRWERIIDKSIEDVVEQHDAENLKEAMEYSLMEQRQQQLADSFLCSDRRDNLQRSISEELLRMQREQLQILQAHQEQQMQNNFQANSPSYMNSSNQYDRQQGSSLSSPHEVGRSRDKPENTLCRPPEYWRIENEAQQRRQQEGDGQDRLRRLQELERQQVQRLQQMETEQIRQQEQLRLMMEEQRRMEENICRQGQFIGGESVDDELENALKLVEALQFGPQHL
jgi:hypothetical protein